MAVAVATGASPSAVAAALAADSLLGLVYFPVASTVGSMCAPPPVRAAAPPSDSAGRRVDPDGATLMAMCAASAIVCVSRRRAGSSAASVAGALAVAVGTLCARPLQARGIVSAADSLGALLLALFFAATGLLSDFKAVTRAPALLAFGLVMYAVHAVSLVAGPRGTGAYRVIASNANVGNPATAVAAAQAQGWHSLVGPAALVGSLGNAIGTPVGMVLGSRVLRPVLRLHGGGV